MLTERQADDLLIGVAILAEYHTAKIEATEGCEQQWHRGARFSLVEVMAMIRGEYDPIGLESLTGYQRKAVDEASEEE